MKTRGVGARIVWSLAVLFFVTWSHGQKQSSAISVNVETPECYVFSHLQKCGGTTIKQIIKKRWGDERKIYDAQQWETGDAWTHDYTERFMRDAGWHVTAGGYTPALMMHGAARCKWFTIFRHPVARLVSAYFYCQELPQDPLCASNVVSAADVDLLTFAKHWGNFALRQFVIGMISADDVMDYANSHILSDGSEWYAGWYLQRRYMDAYFTDNPELPDAALYEFLEPVQNLLRDDYAAVGILEEFNTTLLLFNHALVMPGVDWPSMFAEIGVGNEDKIYRKQKEAALETAWTDTEIKRYIRLDLLLYEHALDVFREQTERYDIAR